MGPIGMQEMIVIVLLALVLFGPKKLPELARMVAKGLTEFRRAKSELKSTFEGHLRELERETRMDEVRSSFTNPTAPYSFVADDYGASKGDYGHGGPDTQAWPTEPPVQTHAQVEPPNGAVPRSLAPPAEPAPVEPHAEVES